MNQRVADLGRRAGQLWRSTAGVAAVEFGLICMPFMLFLFGIVEGSQLLSARNAIQYSVEQTARCYAIGEAQCSTVLLAQQYAAKQVYGLHVEPEMFSASTAPCGALVSASVPYKSVGIVKYKVTLKATSCRP